jgi:hypothetical protein
MLTPLSTKATANGQAPTTIISRRRRASSRRHFRHGWRAAAVRAFTGARLYLDKKAPTLIRAAEDCGSNVHYVRAAIVVIEDGSLNEQALVLTGHLPLLQAANQVRQRLKAERVTVDEAVASWRSWTPEQRAEFGRGAGISEIWDCAIAPVISEERVATV